MERLFFLEWAFKIQTFGCRAQPRDKNTNNIFGIHYWLYLIYLHEIMSLINYQIETIEFQVDPRLIRTFIRTSYRIEALKLRQWNKENFKQNPE